MPTPHVAALYRYPVKGMTPESVERISVLANGAVEGDRVLGFLLADAGQPPRGAWWPKTSFVVLMNTAGLARLNVRLDAPTRRLSVALDGTLLGDADLDDGASREALAAAVTEYVLGLPHSPLAGHPERAPLRLVGDGVTPRYHDRGANHITIINRASVRALAEAIGDEVDERRFRGNVLVDGLAPFEEHTWEGKRVRLGDAEFAVTAPVIRCVATEADPTAGEWNLPILKTLVRAFEQERPRMGVLAEVRRGGGVVVLGDAVEVLG